MKFGHFSDTAREYVITTPRTPLPWINYLGSEAFFSLVSHTAGGYSFYRDAKLRRITRYRYNNVPADSNGRYYYIKDGDTVWNPGWQPTQTELDSYECRHGLGYSIITGKKNSLTAKLELFVPVGDNCEIDRLVLTNESDAPKSFTVFSYLEFCLWNAVDDSTNFQRNFSTGEVEVEGSTIYHKTEYRERRNHYALFTVNTPIDGFDTSRDAFLGAWRSNANPEVVENGRCTNSVAHGWAPVGVHQVNVTLQPGESRSLIFVLGYIENPEDEKWAAPGVINKTRAQAMAARYATDAQVDAALARLHDHWNNLLSTYSVKSSDEKLDRMVNTWNQYQCMVTFNMSRSASYYESGTGRGMGFRDSCQDLLGFVHLIPARARERILDIAATQFPDGSAYHQYQPLTKKGNMDIGSGFNDDPLWLIAAVYAYTKYHLELGEISSYPPGYKENAGIFCHNNPWVSCAETVVGHGDRAFEIYKKTCPAYIEDISEIHRTEPYVYSQMVAGRDAATFGEAKNSWLTGTAAWTFVDVSQYILGIQPTLAGLKIDPCIPHEMDGFTLRRVWRGATYEIVVENPDHLEKGVKAMTVDGKPVSGNILSPVPAGSTVEVKIVMG